MTEMSHELSSEWQMLHQFLNCFREKLKILEGHFSTNWKHALKEIKILIDQEIALRRTVNFHWGKVTGFGIQKNLLKEMKNTKKFIEKVTRSRIPKEGTMTKISEGLFKIMSEFEMKKRMLSKYSNFNVNRLELEVKSLQQSYDNMCFSLANLDEKSEINDLEIYSHNIRENQEQEKKKMTSKAYMQAELPEQNEDFITTELNKLIDAERYSQFPNHTKMETYSNLKIVLKNYSVFFDILNWMRSISQTITQIELDFAVNKFKQVIFLFEEFLKYDNEAFGFVGDLEGHISSVEELVSSSKLDKMVRRLLTC